MTDEPILLGFSLEDFLSVWKLDMTLHNVDAFIQVEEKPGAI